ncbi:MAG TPA: cobalamin-binding protein [Candidatus Binatia bacterium]|jgi:iron complex transport system substrate-binding protein|nr:cobalamin-binding protein [Candidatus Binatia bacterium]
MRVCSLLPGATEIAFALGLGDDVVGVTHECDYPAEARQKPVVVHGLIDSNRMTSLEIDRWVGERLGSNQGLYLLDEERLREAAPDVILTQGLCDVCAIDYNEVVAASETLAKKPKIVSLTPNCLTDVLDDVARVGEATGQRHIAERVVEELEQRISSVREQAATSSARPRVACLEWFDPIYLAGHWVPEMIEIAGAEDVLGRRGEPSEKVEWQSIRESAPEIIVLMPCGFDVPRTLREAGVLERLEGWHDLPAVKAGKVFAVNGHAFFSRPGPRLVDGLEILAHIIHPKIFPTQPPPDVLQRIT